MKVGDIVECVDDQDCCGLLIKGHKYTVIHSDDPSYIKLKETDSALWCAERFSASEPSVAEPQVIKNENVVFCDIDDTLIMTTKPYEGHRPNVWVKDPLTGTTLRINTNEAMIRLVKEEKSRGSYIIAWSRGGYQWSYNVIEALGLKGYVDLVITKPLVYFDDKDVKDWLSYRVYIGPDSVYKNQNQ